MEVTKIGESSLIIYLMHPPIVKGLKMFLMRGVTFNPLIAVGIALFSIGAIYCVRNIGPFRWLR